MASALALDGLPSTLSTIDIAPIVKLRSSLRIGSREWSSMLSTISLRGPWPATSTVMAQELWAERTCVVFVVRRLGCPLCRELVAGLLTYKNDFEEAEADIVLVSTQDIGVEEVATGRFSQVESEPASSEKPSEAAVDSATASATSSEAVDVSDGSAPSKEESVCLPGIKLKVYYDASGAFQQMLGNRRAPKHAALRPDVLARTIVNATKYGGRFDDINEGSEILGGTLVWHPRLGLTHVHQETEDFRNMSADDLVGTVQNLLEKAEDAYCTATAADAW